jgi:hypothetical protein
VFLWSLVIGHVSADSILALARNPLPEVGQGKAEHCKGFSAPILMKNELFNDNYIDGRGPRVVPIY